ncbi:MAG: ATP-binding protein involved in chromosome partitioning [Campylobacterota bacterium]|nr:ATP-binding protein involved in chromosome partitioning [Campylobacterota bacterium]
MSQNKIREKIGLINYPKLDKTLDELKIIEKFIIENDTLKVELIMQNKEAFKTVKEEIEKIAKNEFKSVLVSQDFMKKKGTNYGHTKNPNNRLPNVRKVIAVTSGKGGVGKSTTAVNLAIAFAQAGYKVGLLDADVYGPDVPRMLGLDLEKMQWNDNNKIIPAENFGVKTMSVGMTTPRRDTPLVWRSSVAVSALMQFLEDVEWGELDFMFIDMPPGTGDVQLTMAQELPMAGAVIVTTPQLVANDDVSRAIMMFKDIAVPICGIVENMSYFIAPDTGTRYDIFGKDGGKNTALKYDIEFLGSIPIDMQIREFSDLGKPPVALGTDEHKKAYQAIRDKIIKALL